MELSNLLWNTIKLIRISFAKLRMEFEITKTWDDRKIDHDPVKITLLPGKNDTIQLKISAPYFNDPAPPGGEAGKPYNKLWDYEVVEAFFLGKDDKYLEVEFAPGGEHLLLLLSGAGNAIKMCLPCNYESKVSESSWSGVATLPSSYFPPSVHRFNAYAIHGVGENRVYEALYPVPTSHFVSPNFHRLEFFKPIDFTKISTSNPSLFSKMWEDALKNQGGALTCN